MMSFFERTIQFAKDVDWLKSLIAATLFSLGLGFFLGSLRVGGTLAYLGSFRSGIVHSAGLRRSRSRFHS